MFCTLVFILFIYLFIYRDCDNLPYIHFVTFIHSFNELQFILYINPCQCVKTCTLALAIQNVARDNNELHCMGHSGRGGGGLRELRSQQYLNSTQFVTINRLLTCRRGQ